MPNIDAWLTNAPPLTAWLSDTDMAVDTAILIADKPTSIVVVRGATTLDAQTVRLETLGGDKTVQTPGGVTHSINALVLGYTGHPTITTTNLLPGDRFAVAGVMYEVIMLMPALTTTLQALCTVKG